MYVPQPAPTQYDVGPGYTPIELFSTKCDVDLIELLSTYNIYMVQREFGYAQKLYT